MNFSFWSELEGSPKRYGVEWREGWGSNKQKVHTGYWSLVAAVDRGKSAYPVLVFPSPFEPLTVDPVAL